MPRTLGVMGLEDERLLEERLRQHGISLSAEEARRVMALLGREPTLVEWHIFNVEWSEHCSYKSSKRVLRALLPTEAPNVILGPSEDAGIVFLAEVGGKRYALVVAHESHNHPSQVLPVEGAATGIGGIVRDVNCMGAHVIAVADPLRFGDPFGAFAARSRWIANGVVDGIWQYANALGVPNIAGDVFFSSCFDDNCLVNVVALGIVAEEDIIRSRVPPEAAGEPYDIILVGKPTDHSGFGGAAFASGILAEEEEQDARGAVQVPDPFLKNVLLLHKANEAVWQAAKRAKAVIGMKDLGAAGIAGSSSEIVAAPSSPRFGARIDLDRVPVSVPNLLPEVIACSETQERYLLVVPRRFTPEVLRIYNEEWDLPHVYEGACAAVIGEVTLDGRYVLLHQGEVVCDVEVRHITEGIEYERPARPRGWEERDPDLREVSMAVPEVLQRLLASPNIASREHIYRMYDTEVQGRAVIRSGEADAGVMVPLPGEPVAIAVSVDGNPRYGRISPYWGGANAVAEAMRNVAAVGAVPWALTDCLNFGNPEKPEAFWDFVESVRGMADAARALELKPFPGHPVPIVSGNVSFYNESATGRAIDPSPIVCCIGRMEDYSKAITLQLKEPGNDLWLVGPRYEELGGSAFLEVLFGLYGHSVPQVRFPLERAMIYAITDAIEAGLLRSCHDISNGGLLVTVVEMAMGGWGKGRWGVELEAEAVGEASEGTVSEWGLWFGESSGFVFEARPQDAQGIEELFARRGVKPYRIGRVLEEPQVRLRSNGRLAWNLPLETLKSLWLEGLPRALR